MFSKLFSILILVPFFAGAQLQRNFTSYTVDDGLAQNTVWDAYQDQKGYMWFGTADGVNRFDGYKMYHYKWNSSDSSTLLGSTTFRFYEDRSNNLWISHNKGVSVYNRAKDCFTNISLSVSIPDASGDRYTTVLGEDAKGRVWIISGNLELLSISKKDLSIQKAITVSSSKYILSSIRTCIVTKKYIIGFLNDSNTTWFRLNTENDKVDIINGPPNYTGYFIRYNDSTICTFDKQNFHLYDINQNKFRAVRIKNSHEAPLMATSMVWWQGRIYVGNSTGLYIFNPHTNEFEERITSFKKNENIGFYYVQFLRVDRSGNLWVCTNGDGAKCLSPYRNKFKHFSTNVSSSRLVKSITTDSANTIYTGLFAEGLIRYKPNGDAEQYKFGKSKDEQSHVLAVTVWNNKFYVVNDRYLKQLDPVSKKETMVTDVFHYKNRGFVAYPRFYEYKKRLFLSCDIAVYEVLPDNKLKSLHRFKGIDTIITTFWMLNDSIWWVGTTKGLYEFNLANHIWKRLPVDIYMKTLCMSERSKHIWAGGNAGLFLLNTQGKLLQKFDVSNGLPDDFIYGILEDKYGKLWMSHNKGMSVYDPQTKTFKHYGVKDGLQSNEFNTGAYYKDKKGLLYFGGVNGVNVIDPDKIEENRNLPAISINQILLGDLPYKADTTYNEIKQLTFSYTENTLSFDFSALEFSQPEDNTYKYMLEGYDKDWIQSGTRHFARYANLPPGDYTLKIMAANGDGFWNPEPKKLMIDIVPPFWQRSWFYLLTGLLVVGGIGTVVYFVVRRQKAKLQRELEVQQKLEEERLRISRDLHDNVGAQLSYLITNMEWMQNNPDKMNTTETSERLHSLTDAGRNAILTLRQTIWAISHTELSVDDFADRFKQYALKLIAFDQRIHLHFDENFTAQRTLSPAQALNIFRVCQEAFNNCLKHAQCTHIQISFASSDDVLFTFVIVDDGVGFDWSASKRKGHYGLVNMEARVQESGATLLVESAVGAGTTLTITVK